MKSYSAKDAFCDENGFVTEEFPGAFRSNEFNENGNSTIVNIEIEYKSKADLEKVLELGFKKGFTAVLENPDDLLK